MHIVCKIVPYHSNGSSVEGGRAKIRVRQICCHLKGGDSPTRPSQSPSREPDWPPLVTNSKNFCQLFSKKKDHFKIVVLSTIKVLSSRNRNTETHGSILVSEMESEPSSQTRQSQSRNWNRKNRNREPPHWSTRHGGPKTQSKTSGALWAHLTKRLELLDRVLLGISNQNMSKCTTTKHCVFVLICDAS